MQKHLACSLMVALAVAAFLTLSPPAAGQGVSPEGSGVPMVSLDRLQSKTTGPAPRTADGKPDLTGLWQPDRHFQGDISRALKPGEALPLQPWALKLTQERLSKDDPHANCLPSGIPRLSPFPWKIVQTPKLIVFLYEGNIHSYRQIFMDGRDHPTDMDPTWYGDSIGKWDGNALVVDTVGFNDKFWFDSLGHPHTEKLHVTERYRRPDYGHLDYEVTIDDPGAYTKPFTLYAQSPLLENTEIMEYICAENNQDVSHVLGPSLRRYEGQGQTAPRK
jgi:hypothetical protein